ncbi:MAG TPA: hypothetical protein VLG12_05225 [Candidatus Saccharimonadales bacterium]|nr:hypothetical protein [Candidatus Saccharimonadales bacterium]
MDDSQKIQQNTPQSDDQTQQIVTPVTTVSQQPSEKKEETTPVSPVSSPSKEGGPTPSITSESLISASTPEMEISPTLHTETGAEAVSETPILTPEDAKAGIVHAKESTPVSTAAATIVLPMTQQQAQQTVKIHKKVKDSLLWFAMLIMRQWQIAQKNKKKEQV